MSRSSACSSCDKANCPSQGRQSGETDEQFAQRQKLAKRMESVKHKILVMSGKGGVGKSTIAANLATYLALNGRTVGLLDVDVHGPSVPGMFGLAGKSPAMDGDSIVPLDVGGTLRIMSIGFLLEDADAAVIWRGPMKIGVIQQFIRDVQWGELDCLIVDCPPGTGDEPLTAAQSLADADGAVIVTTPQDVAVSDVRRSISFCRQLALPVLGVVENMSGFACPHCGEITDVFGSGGGEEMAQSMNIPFLGRIPLDPQVVASCDEGKPHAYFQADTDSSKAFEACFATLLDLTGHESKCPQERMKEE
ncbi:MAG: Mrp/NBP35 family ATP-binding protein [Lentisphaeria bacterium]|nr:Mrp/NBP35 family ATP-binding protein [Lentisphaeria bacterium]